MSGGLGDFDCARGFSGVITDGRPTALGRLVPRQSAQDPQGWEIRTEENNFLVASVPSEIAAEFLIHILERDYARCLAESLAAMDNV